MHGSDSLYCGSAADVVLQARLAGFGAVGQPEADYRDGDREDERRRRHDLAFDGIGVQDELSFRVLKHFMNIAASGVRVQTDRSQAGFSLAELLIATAILLIVSSTVTSGLLQLTTAHRSITNRTDMHNGVRSATELLQQEVGQAGRVALPGTTVTLAGAVGVGPATVGVIQTINGAAVPSVSGIFPNELLVIDSGGPNPCVTTTPCQETVTVTGVNTLNNQITATFAYPHNAGAAVNAFGGFSAGVVPPQPGYANGSTGTKLKLIGDINGDGTVMYLEYSCDFSTVPGKLYRSTMAIDAAAKPAVTDNQILLSNILPNPGGTACFSYLPNPLPVVGANTYVLDVAITLTVQTQMKDPTTGQYQTETKALLNVSPRNVFNVWQLASAGFTNRIQPVPPNVTAVLLAN
jgi:prepilin-type N-terminal cleavage/methylation domain-containing protein